MGKKKTKNNKNVASQLAGNKKLNRYEKKRIAMQLKKNPDYIPELPSKLSKLELANAKIELEPLVHEANQRIEMIKALGLTSHAVERVITEGGGRDYFDLEEISNQKDLLKEITRMRIFISDKGSTVDIAKLETAQIEAEIYRGKFGNEYNTEEYGKARFDTKTLDLETAKKVFENYHKIAESKSALITEKGGYGSENLILAMYDAEVKGYDSFGYGVDLLDVHYETGQDDWKRKKEMNDDVLGIAGYVEDRLTGGYIR